MTTYVVARQYANAAFDVVQANGQVETFGRQLQALADLIADHADLRRALESPAVPRHVKRDLTSAVAAHAEAPSVELQRLIAVMAENERLPLIPAVAQAFKVRAMDAAGVITAELISAQPLDADRQAALARALGAATGRRVELTGRVDESMIGGVIAKVGGTVYDGSVASQLARMRQRLVTDA